MRVEAAAPGAFGAGAGFDAALLAGLEAAPPGLFAALLAGLLAAALAGGLLAAALVAGLLAAPVAGLFVAPLACFLEALRLAEGGAEFLLLVADRGVGVGAPSDDESG